MEQHLLTSLIAVAETSSKVAEGLPNMISQIGILFMLFLLQAVLGFDNLLYISLESKRAPEKDQERVRKLGIGIAIILRIVLLFLLVKLVSVFQDPIVSFNNPVITGTFNVHAIIVLIGGVFIMYTATKEILHMMRIDHGHGMETEPKSAAYIITWIVIMNLIFSFDSILSAMALAQYHENGEVKHIMWVMIVAIILTGLLMIFLADKVSKFLLKNRMYEVVGLFILFIVGILLLTEGAHLAHLTVWGSPIQAMTKTTFYFVIFVLFIVEIVQSRYQKKLLAENPMPTEDEKPLS